MEPTEKQKLIHRMLFPYNNDKLTISECCKDIRIEVKSFLKLKENKILIMLARSLDIYLEEYYSLEYIATSILREVCRPNYPKRNPPLVRKWARYGKIARENETFLKLTDEFVKLLEEYDEFDGNSFIQSLELEIEEGYLTYDDIVENRINIFE